MPKLKELMKALEELAPKYLAESWDNVGLMIGKPSKEITKVLCALDLNETVVDEAITLQAECIVTHHPFLFKPLKQIDLESSRGRLIEKLIKHDIAVYAMHTNYDAAPGGLNDYLAQKLSLKEVKVLDETFKKQLYKAAIYVPRTHLEVVREAIVKNMSSEIGNYSGCTFSKPGEGTFIPLEGSSPYLGSLGTLEKVEESQISFMGTYEEIEYIISEVKKVHPYEEIAIDVYALANMEKSYGIGRYGLLDEELSLNDFIAEVKKCFGIEYVRVTNLSDHPVKRVAICSGSGSEYLAKAAKVSDVFITGDMKFHEGQMAQELGLTVIDVGHYASEQIALEPIKNCLLKAFSECQVFDSKVNGETLFIV